MIDATPFLIRELFRIEKKDVILGGGFKIIGKFKSSY